MTPSQGGLSKSFKGKRKNTGLPGEGDSNILFINLFKYIYTYLLEPPNELDDRGVVINTPPDLLKEK